MSGNLPPPVTLDQKTETVIEENVQPPQAAPNPPERRSDVDYEPPSNTWIYVLAAVAVVAVVGYLLAVAVFGY